MIFTAFDKLNAETWTDDSGVVVRSIRPEQPVLDRDNRRSLNRVLQATAVTITLTVTLAFVAVPSDSRALTDAEVASASEFVAVEDHGEDEPEFQPRPREITPEFRKASLARILDKWKVGLDLLA